MITDELFLRPLFDWRSAVASRHGPEKPTTRFVLLTLALHMSPKGDSCFPSIDRLAEESGLSRRAVIEHLQIAEATGWLIKKDRAMRSTQGWRRIEYYGLIPQGIEEQLRTPREKVVQDDHHVEGGDRSAEGGDRDRKKVVHQGHPSTSLSTSRALHGKPVDKLSTTSNPTTTQAPIAEQPWWESNQGMIDMAAKYGVNTMGLTAFALRGRINEAIAKQGPR